MSRSINALDPGPPAASGDLYELEVQLKSQFEGRVHDFQLLRDEKGLVLLGRTNSYYMKQLAQEAVRQGSELPIAANRIAVRQTA